MTTILGNRTPPPPPGQSFRIHALHTAGSTAPWFTGSWHRSGHQPTDPNCALWITITEQDVGAITVTVEADHEATPGAFRRLARITGLRPDNWTGAIAPTVAAHHWTTRIEHRRPSKSPDRLARALLAHLIVHR